MRNGILILLAVAAFVAFTGAGAATFAPIIEWAKGQLSSPFWQGVITGAIGLYSVQTVFGRRGRR